MEDPFLSLRWKKWHWFTLIPEQWHHSPHPPRSRLSPPARWGGCVRIGWRPQPIRAHTQEAFKKDSEKCRKVVQKPQQQVLAWLRWSEKRYQRICCGLPPVVLPVLRTESCYPASPFLKPSSLSSTVNRQKCRMSTHFRSGPAFGLSAEVKSKVGSQSLCRVFTGYRHIVPGELTARERSRVTEGYLAL